MPFQKQRRRVSIVRQISRTRRFRKLLTSRKNLSAIRANSDSEVACIFGMTWPPRPLAIGIGCAMFQQITGINTVIYFAPMIAAPAGRSFGGHLDKGVPSSIRIVVQTFPQYCRALHWYNGVSGAGPISICEQLRIGAENCGDEQCRCPRCFGTRAPSLSRRWK